MITDETNLDTRKLANKQKQENIAEEIEIDN